MNISIGNNIRIARKKMGLTQEELASQLGVTAQAVSRWESETGMPDISMVVPLAQALSISTDTLFGLTQNSYNELHYREVKNRIDELYDGMNIAESALNTCHYVLEEIKKDPANYAILCLLVEQTANLSRYVDFDNFARDEWPSIRDTVIHNGLQVIRYSEDKELVERAHYGLAWIYIHESDYASAREHIETLPSVASNRLQESILAQLASFEHGIDALKEVLRKNLQNFTRALNKEICYAIEDFRWYAPPEEAIAFGKWGLRIINVLSENPDMISYCLGFTRDCHKYLISAYLLKEDYEGAANQFAELKQDMNRHFEYYQMVLQTEEERKKFDTDVLHYMNTYTKEYIEKTQAEILNQLKSWHGDDIFSKFECQL